MEERAGPYLLSTQLLCRPRAGGRGLPQGLAGSLPQPAAVPWPGAGRLVASAALAGSRTQGVTSGHHTFSRRPPARHLSAGSRMARPWHPAAGLLVCILPAPGFFSGWVGGVDRKWKEQLSSPMSATRMLRHPKNLQGGT